jgi:hypothetical protein
MPPGGAALVSERFAFTKISFLIRKEHEYNPAASYNTSHE